MARFDLSDEEWAVILPLLSKKGRGLARKDDRTVLNGIFFILRTGAPWVATECEDALVFVDSSIVKAHRTAADATYGPPRCKR